MFFSPADNNDIIVNVIQDNEEPVKSPTHQNIQSTLHTVQSALHDVQASLHNASYTQTSDTSSSETPFEEEQQGYNNKLWTAFKEQDRSRQCQNLENCIRKCLERHGQSRAVRDGTSTGRS